jgi:hypothetical protein
MSDRFDAVAVRIADERREVVRPILETDFWRTFVHCAASHGCSVKCDHRFSARRRERQMRALHGSGASGGVAFDREAVITASIAIPNGVTRRPDAHQPKRSKDGVVKRSGPVEIGDAKRDVVEQLLGSLEQKDPLERAFALVGFHEPETVLIGQIQCGFDLGC